MRKAFFLEKSVIFEDNFLSMSEDQFIYDKNLNEQFGSFIKECLLNEPLASYSKTPSWSEFFLDKMLVMKAIKLGVPFNLFELIKSTSSLSDLAWANLLDLSTKSLQRYKLENRHFGPLQSEKILEIAEVNNMGIDVFGTIEKFGLWLDTPNFALANEKPSSLLVNSYGKSLLMAELNRINYGIFA